MSQDNVWQIVRYVLIAGGSYFAGRGKIDPAQVTPLTDDLISLLSGAAALGSAAWGLWVKFRTATVTAKTAARIDVPTVSAATGAVQ